MKSSSAFTTPDTLAFLYNTRSELTSATAAVGTSYCYGYAFNDIGFGRDWYAKTSLAELS